MFAALFLLPSPAQYITPLAITRSEFRWAECFSCSLVEWRLESVLQEKASVKQTFGTGTASVFVELYFGRCATGSVYGKSQILRSTGVKGVGEVTNSPSRAECSLLSLLMVTDLTPPNWRSTKMPFSRLRRAAPVSTVVPLVSLCFPSLRRLVTSLQSKFFDPLFILSPPVVVRR